VSLSKEKIADFSDDTNMDIEEKRSHVGAPRSRRSDSGPGSAEGLGLTTIVLKLSSGSTSSTFDKTIKMCCNVQVRNHTFMAKEKSISQE
jgi:hypothetical protein